MKTFKAGTGTIRIGEPTAAEAKELAALFDERDANERKLYTIRKDALRKDALREHYGEFVIITNRGEKVRYYPDEKAFTAAISAEESGAAVHDHLVERPESLIV